MPLLASTLLPGRSIGGSSGPTRLDRHTRWLSDELPYLFCGDYDGFGPLHLLADGALGYAFELEMPTVDTLPEGEDDVARALVTMLHAVPPGMHWQWFSSSTSCVEPELSRYESQAGSDGITAQFVDAFIRRWRMAQQEGFFPDEPAINFHPRARSLVVALKSEPMGFARPGTRELIASMAPDAWRPALRKILERWQGAEGQRQRIDRFLGGVQDVLAAAHAANWAPRALDDRDLIAFLTRLLFPQRLLGAGSRVPAAAGAAADPSFEHNELRLAIAALGRIDEAGGSGFRSLCGAVERHHRVVSMLWQPRTVAAGLLNELASLRPQLTVSVSASTVAPAAALLQLKARALLNARSTHRFNTTEMEARAEALQEVEQRIFAEGERIFELRLQVHVTEESAEAAEQAANVVCRTLEALEIEATVERDVGTALLLRGCLPFAVYPETERKLRRRRRLLSRDGADLHPAGGCWTGVAPNPPSTADIRPTPIVMYSNPLGEPLFIDPTKAEKNPHALVIGQSGSGKSFFVHDFLLHLWRLPDVRLFLISIKPDYRKLALLLGRYVEITLDSAVSLNPFGGRPSLENQAKWFAALVLMLHEGKEDVPPLTREEEVALQSAAQTAAQRNWDAALDRAIRETLLEDVCTELERGGGPIGRQLALRLHPYRRGPYRRLFNAPRNVSATERFIFFNLGNILRQPCAALASFCVFSLVDEVMTDAQLRGTPKGLIADEVWALVRNPHAAAILERSLKAYRSLGGFAMPIVQDPQDLDTPSGRVMLVNTATKVILPLDRTGHADLDRYVRLNEREAEIVRNLKLVKRRYSEFFVSIDGMKSAKGLLIPDPLRYAIATTDPADEERIERLHSETGDMFAAIRRFAREAPFGRYDSSGGAGAVAHTPGLTVPRPS
jgi:conjugal transfer ATP-binding protein TraC